MCKVLEEIDSKIEKLRQLLNDSILSNATEEEITELSHKMDDLIVMYYMIQKKYKYKHENKY